MGQTSPRLEGQRAICVPGVGSTKPFSALIVDTMPDLERILNLVPVQPHTLEPQHFRIGQRAMRFADDSRTILIVNEHLRLEGIPHEAHEYSVNGRTPLEWFIDRYRITRDRESGIINDPNGWFDDPRDLITAIRRILHVSVETVGIVTRLPDPFTGEDCDQDGGPS